MTKEETYDAEINPLMAQIIAICKRSGIGCLCAFDISPAPEQEEGPLLCTTCLPDETGHVPESLRPAANAALQSPSGLMAFTITTTRENEVKP